MKKNYPALTYTLENFWKGPRIGTSILFLFLEIYFKKIMKFHIKPSGETGLIPVQS